MNRRILFSLAVATFVGVKKAFAKPTAPQPRYRKIKWIKLNEETLSPGDFWACMDNDPNEPQQQGTPGYNLQMQAIHPTRIGQVAKDIPLGNGGFWRPVGLVDVF